MLPLFARGPKGYRAWPKRERPAAISYHPLSWLLEQRHDDDAHIAAYSVPNVLHRLGTDPAAYAQIPGGVPMQVLLLDLDCAKSHRALGGASAVAADDAWWQAHLPQLEALLTAHPGGYVYRTRGGLRIVYQLPAPVVITDGASELGWKRLYLSRLAYLARRFELVCDPSISDWPRLIRLPHVTRNGKRQTLDVIGRARSVGALDYEPSEADELADLDTARRLATRERGWAPALRILARNATPTRRAPRAPRLAETVAPRELDVGTWSALARDLGRALRALHGRHAVHLALAGACYARGVPLAQGPTLARAIMSHSGETDDRPQVWETTASRLQSGQAVTGFGYLAEHYPDLAAVVDTALPADGGARACRDELDARGIPEAIAATDAHGIIRAAIAAPPPGLSLVRATEGAGKTRAAAAELRAAALASADLERVPSARKVLYVAPTHAVAASVARELEGTRSVYLRGVLSITSDLGRPVCTYHVALGRLLAGGHSANTWCDGRAMGHKGADSPCPRRAQCPAPDASELRLWPGDESPVVMVTVHAMLGEGLAWAGESARVIIDEDPEAVEAHTLTRAELESAAAAPGFALSESWRTPVLRALAAGLERGEIPTGPEALLTVWRRGCEALEGDAGWLDAVNAELSPTAGADELLQLAAIRAAWSLRRPDDGPVVYHRRGAWAPRPDRRERAAVFTGSTREAFVHASEVHARVARMIAGVVRAAPEGVQPHAERAVVAVEAADLDPSRRVIRVVQASPPVAAALHRWGPTVLLDATADIAVVRALAGTDVPVVEVRVADGAPVSRKLLYWSGASRKNVLAGDMVRWDTGLARYASEAIRLALAWCERPRVGLFTWKALADRVRAALAGTGDDEGARQLVTMVQAAGAELTVGHYGAERGRDDWKGVDVLLSIGDPRANLGATRAIAAVLGLSEQHQAVYRRATAATASQVAGRLRAPWRTDRALHVHVGTVPPASWDARAEVCELPRGSVEALDAGAVAEAVGVYGSQRLAAADLGVRRQTVTAISGKSIAFAQSHAARSNAIQSIRMAEHRAACDCAESLENHPNTPPIKAPRAFDNSTQQALITSAGGAARVAALLGCSKPTAYHWASGKRPMPADLRAALTAHLRAAEAPAAPPKPPLVFAVPAVNPQPQTGERKASGDE